MPSVLCYEASLIGSNRLYDSFGRSLRNQNTGQSDMLANRAFGPPQGPFVFFLIEKENGRSHSDPTFHTQ